MENAYSPQEEWFSGLQHIWSLERVSTLSKQIGYRKEGNVSISAFCLSLEPLILKTLLLRY